MKRLFSVTAFSAVMACWGPPVPTGGDPGTPLDDLTQAERIEFLTGLALFDKVYLPEEGLGPLFNENQCSACHTSPASGGTTGFERVVKATRFDETRGCNTLAEEGGENVRTQVTPLLKAHGVTGESVPSSATEIGRFLPPFLFGLGLVEAIPDEVILSAADPEDRDGDGISGRAGRTADGRLARFGRKAEFATIAEFVRTALRLEMGLTSREDDRETISGQPLPPGVDPVPEPEVDGRTVDLMTAFVRFLTPPAPAPPRSRAHGDTLDAGRRLFDQLRCSDCHTPALRTGTTEVAALSGKTVALYSDLLLHDMGPALRNVCAPGATPTELRTEMLMGLQYRDRYLHDGRTSDLRAAILAHGGEAQRSRDAFDALTWLRQEFVLAFLRSL